MCQYTSNTGYRELEQKKRKKEASNKIGWKIDSLNFPSTCNKRSMLQNYKKKTLWRNGGRKYIGKYYWISHIHQTKQMTSGIAQHLRQIISSGSSTRVCAMHDKQKQEYMLPCIIKLLPVCILMPCWLETITLCGELKAEFKRTQIHQYCLFGLRHDKNLSLAVDL